MPLSGLHSLDDPPSRADHSGLNDATFNALSYADKKKAVVDWFGFEDDMSCPWIEVGADDIVAASSDTEPRLMAWLSEPIETDDELSWAPSWLSQYLPGFEIMDALGEAAQNRLGLREVDVGGPASGGCWAVEVRASPAELDAVLAAAGLPLRVHTDSLVPDEDAVDSSEGA